MPHIRRHFAFYLFLVVPFNGLCLAIELLAKTESAIVGHGRSKMSLFRRVYLSLMGVSIGTQFYLSARGFYLFRRNALSVGNRSSFGEFTRIWNFADIVIGDDFMAAAGLTLLTGGHDADSLNAFQKSICIGDRVWCGANVTILPGVHIGNDVVIAAGSVVNRNIEDCCIVGGIPAKFIRKVDMEKRRHMQHELSHEQ